MLKDVLPHHDIDKGLRLPEAAEHVQLIINLASVELVEKLHPYEGIEND